MMVAWFVGLSLVAKLWTLYAAGVALIFALALAWEYWSPKVDGAAGWMLFAAIMLSLYGFFLAAIASVVILLVKKFL